MKRNDRDWQEKASAILVIGLCLLLVSPVVALYVTVLFTAPAWPYGG